MAACQDMLQSTDRDSYKLEIRGVYGIDLESHSWPNSHQSLLLPVVYPCLHNFLDNLFSDISQNINKLLI